MITAVLAVFLVAALFIGAASAAIAGAETVFVYQNHTDYLGTWYLSSDNSKTITFDSNGVLTGDNIVEGTYTNGTTGSAVVVKYPTATIGVTLSGSTASVIGGTVAQASSLNFSTTMLNNVSVSGLIFDTPAGGQTTMFAGSDFSVMNSSNNVPLTDVKPGLWSVHAKFTAGDSAPANLTSTTPAQYLIGHDAYSFTVASTSNAVSVDKSTVVKGNNFLLTVSGTPGQEVKLSTTATGIDAIAGQENIVGTSLALYPGFNVTIGDSGTTVIEFTTSDDATFTITALFKNADKKTVKVTVEKGSVTATVDNTVSYIGSEISFSGTDSSTSSVALYIVGKNVGWTQIGDNASVNGDDTWSKKLTIDDISTGGSYSVYAVAIDSTHTPQNETDAINNFAFDTVVLTLQQPFLTADVASTTIAKGDKIKITGTAEATDELKWYIFGANKFQTGDITVDDDSSYSVKIPTVNLDAGQYYVIIQHPMINKEFNILGNQTTGNVYQNYTGKPTYNTTDGVATGNTTLIFNAKALESSNAAEALKVALGDQYIDDQYRSLYFVVETPYLKLNTVADQTKGSTFTVSGTTNVASGEIVTVDVTSTAFTPGDKTSTASTSSYLVATTEVVAGTDGANTWTVTFDTTGLDVDSYTINAEISTKSLASSTTFKVIEVAPTKTATTTATATKTATATTTPTPQSPGFGAFLALAGLGAVAVLVLRRN